MQPDNDRVDNQPTGLPKGQVIDFATVRRTRQAVTGRDLPARVASTDRHIRTRQNVVALLFVAVLVAAGVWLIVQLRDSLRSEICIEAGRRNCAPVVVPK